MSTQTVWPTKGEAAKRRGQAIAGAVAGLAVVIVLVAVYFVVKAGDNGKATTPTAAAPASAQPEQAQPTDAAAPTDQAPSAAAPAPVDTPPALSKEPVVKAGTGTLSKLTVTPLVKGTGAKVQAGQTVTANYVLVKYADGTVLDSSWKRGEPFSTPIGTGAVIKGWDQAIPGQRVGSRIQLDVPAALAYGAEQGDLRFVVDILAAK